MYIGVKVNKNLIKIFKAVKMPDQTESENQASGENTATLTDVISDVTGDIPAGDVFGVTPVAQPAESTPVTDKGGNIFDANLYESDNGIPRLTVDGMFKKKRGRGANRVAMPADVTGAEQPAVIQEQCGQVSAKLFIAMGILLLGDDFRAENQAEEKVLADAFKAYLQSKNLSDIPAGWALAIILVQYTATRLTKPTIRTKIIGFFGYCKGWINARFNRGHNRDRKNDIS
jgi:hypothetical protein